MRTLTLLGLAASSLLAFGCNEANSPAEIPADPVPLGVTLEGDALTTSNFRGQVTLVCFWATWCGLSTHALSDLASGHYEFLKGPAVVAINLDSDPAALDAFVKDKNYPFYFTRGNADVQNTFHVTGIPTYFLFDPQGHQCWRYVGYAPPDTVNAALSLAR